MVGDGIRGYVAPKLHIVTTEVHHVDNITALSCHSTSPARSVCTALLQPHYCLTEQKLWAPDVFADNEKQKAQEPDLWQLSPSLFWPVQVSDGPEFWCNCRRHCHLQWRIKMGLNQRNSCFTSPTIFIPPGWLRLVRCGSNTAKNEDGCAPPTEIAWVQ